LCPIFSDGLPLSYLKQYKKNDLYAF